MLSNLAKTFFLACLVIAGSIGIYVYQAHYLADVRIQKLQQEAQELKQIIQRLSDQRRVAEVLVTDQKTVNGQLQTTLLFQEYSRDGKTPLPPKSFVIQGKVAHIDALVIKFDRDFVQQDDPLRGHSIALFYRIFGENQRPADGSPIDTPGQVPDIYRDDSASVSAFEQDLWTNFWKLVNDPAYRQAKGVRIAQGESPWGPFEPERLYTITLDADGGLNLSSEPLRGIYREALRRREES